MSPTLWPDVSLHVVSGTGWFQTEGEARIEIHAGDTIFIPPGERHWHGATATQMMSPTTQPTVTYRVRAATLS